MPTDYVFDNKLRGLITALYDAYYYSPRLAYRDSILLEELEELEKL